MFEILELKTALAEIGECKKTEKTLKMEQRSWNKQLQTAKENSQRSKQMVEYLMDQYRPDYR